MLSTCQPSTVHRDSISPCLFQLLLATTTFGSANRGIFFFSLYSSTTTTDDFGPPLQWACVDPELKPGLTLKEVFFFFTPIMAQRRQCLACHCPVPVTKCTTHSTPVACHQEAADGRTAKEELKRRERKKQNKEKVGVNCGLAQVAWPPRALCLACFGPNSYPPTHSPRWDWADVPVFKSLLVLSFLFLFL